MLAQGTGAVLQGPGQRQPGELRAAAVVLPSQTIAQCPTPRGIASALAHAQDPIVSPLQHSTHPLPPASPGESPPGALGHQGQDPSSPSTSSEGTLLAAEAEPWDGSSRDSQSCSAIAPWLAGNGAAGAEQHLGRAIPWQDPAWPEGPSLEPDPVSGSSPTSSHHRADKARPPQGPHHRPGAICQAGSSQGWWEQQDRAWGW